MAVCDCCGSEYEPSLAISYDGRSYHFDCFECAIELLAPLCQHCGTKMIGHGAEVDGLFFCCTHCAQAEAKGGKLRPTG